MGGGHGIGIKRNDWHRRNRRRNISMHSHSHGYQRPGRESAPTDVEITVQVIKLKRLKELAAEDWKNHSHKLFVGRTRIRNPLVFKCLKYVQHKLTNYDLLTKHADSKSYLTILKKTNDKIAKIYPYLAKECERQYLRVAKQRHHNVVRIIKRNTLSQEQLAEFNAREEEKWKGILAALEQEEMANDEMEINLTEALSSLASERLLFFPPFLKKDEIERRRFYSGLENNDRWWEWEKELGLSEKRERISPYQGKLTRPRKGDGLYESE